MRATARMCSGVAPQPLFTQRDRAHTHTHTHTLSHTHKHDTHTHTYTRTYTHTPMMHHTHTHTHTRTGTHAYMDAHTPPSLCILECASCRSCFAHSPPLSKFRVLACPIPHLHKHQHTSIYPTNTNTDSGKVAPCRTQHATQHRSPRKTQNTS